MKTAWRSRQLSLTAARSWSFRTRSRKPMDTRPSRSAMASSRRAKFLDFARLDEAIADLDGLVSIGFRLLVLNDHDRAAVNDSCRDRQAVFIKQLCHTSFPAKHEFLHFSFTSLV